MWTDTKTRAQLLREGRSVTWIASAVHRGDLIRLRRGHYATPDLDSRLQRAVRVGGRLTCISELRRRGVWAFDDGRLHVHVVPNAARLRDPDDRRSALASAESVARIHWSHLEDPRRAAASRVSLIDAFLHAADCLGPVGFRASLDSAAHLGLLNADALHVLRSRIPERLRSLCESDGVPESGIETIVIQLAIALGFQVRAQPRFPGVGRADVLIEDWVLVECDGGKYHAAEVTARDRTRDAGFQRAGRTVLHFRYSQIVYDLEALALTLIAAVENHRRIPNAAHLARRARRRLPRALIQLGLPPSSDFEIPGA